MAENVFEAVKQSVSTREAAEFYGIKVRRTGMACCPFHDDKNPSMKVDQRFHCFGCGEDGDVIDFTAKLFDLSPKEAAEKLAQDFGLIYDSQAPPRRKYVRQKTEAQQFREDRQRCYRVLSDYYHLLKKWESDHSPRTPEEKPHPRFVEAIQKKAYVEYLLDLFLYESEEEQKAWIAEHTAEITHLERRLKIMAENKPTNRERLREITDGIEQGIKELFESEKYMRYLSVMSRFHRYSVNNTMLIYTADQTMKRIESVIGGLNIDVFSIADKFCKNDTCVVLRTQSEIEHIFSELYRVEPRMIAYYLKVKVLELLMFLNQVSLQDYQEERRYFARNQVQTIKKMQEYMTADLRNHYTLQELSEKFEIPLTSMKVCFKGVYGCSIYAYMKSYRMQAATILLRDTSDSITEIAAKMGYDNPSKFSEVFKKEFGELPSEFRKKLSK